MKYVPIQPDMVPMRDTNVIEKGDRLFYEIGYKLDALGGYGSNWIRTGTFKEVVDVSNMLKYDNLIGNLDYLNYHNFMLIKAK